MDLYRGSGLVVRLYAGLPSGSTQVVLSVGEVNVRQALP